MDSIADSKPIAPKVDTATPANVGAAGDAAKAAAPVAPKIDAAVAQVKATPPAVAAKAKPVRAARKAVAAKAKPVKAPAPRRAVNAPAMATPTSAAPKRAIPALSQLKDKIMDTTTQTTDFAASVKTAAADAQTRAKATYDKLQGFAGEMTEMTKGNVEAIVEAGKILGAGVQDIARGEYEATKGVFETATADLKAMAAVKSPTELFKLQGEIARRNFDAVVARASKNAEVSVKLVNDAFAPISNRMSLAAERLSNAA